MTDIHSHILFGVDDGSSSLEESLKLLKKMESVGFNNIILTPHFIEDSRYQALNDEKLARLTALKEAAINAGIQVNLYLGNEIFVNDHIPDLINEGKVYPLNGTKYVLFELPFHNQILNLQDIIYEIKYQGYIPVLAHPERYAYFQEDYSLVDSLKEEGLLFQSNFSSILGHFGKHAQKLLKYMLKNEYIDFLGTDIHHADKAYVIDNFKKIEKHIKKIAGENYYERIISNGNNLIKEK